MAVRSSFVGAVLAVVLAAGCGGGGSRDQPQEPSSPPAPSLLLGQLEAQPDSIVLEWGGGPAQVADAIQLEASEDGTTWLAFGDPISTEWMGAVVYFDPTRTEGLAVSFRAVAVKGELRSEPSAPVSVLRPVRPADALQVAQAPGAVTVSWTRLATNAVPVLERRLVRPCGTGSGWSTLSVPAGATGLVDTAVSGWTDGAAFEYRLTFEANGVVSGERLAQGPHAPFLAPTLWTTVTADGPVLHWIDVSASADRIAVFDRDPLTWNWRRRASVPVSDGGWLDATAAPGVGRYAIEATCSLAADGSGAMAVALGLNPAPEVTAAFDVSLVQTPVASWLGRSPSGRWSVLVGAELWLGTPEEPDPAWSTTQLDPINWNGPLSHPGETTHLVGSRMDANGDTEVVHAWGDGSAPLEGEVALTVPFFPSGGGSATVDAAGAVHVAYAPGMAVPAGGTRLAFVHAVRGAAGWTTEEVPACDAQGVPAAALSSRLAVDPAGDPAMVLSGNGSAFLARRGGGGWSCEPIPSGVEASPSSLLLLTAGESLWIYTDPAAGALIAEERGPTGWAPPIVLGPIASTWLAVGAASPDGSRAAVAIPGTLLVRDGGWTAIPIPEATAMDLGFGPDGKLWVALNALTTAPEQAQSVLLRER